MRRPALSVRALRLRLRPGVLAARLRGMPGVIEAVIVADEGVAYLKVDRDRFDDVALGEIVAGPA